MNNASDKNFKNDLEKSLDDLKELFELQLSEKLKLQEEIEKDKETIKKRKESLREKQNRKSYLEKKQHNTMIFQIGDLVYKNIIEQGSIIQLKAKLEDLISKCGNDKVIV
ncbi:hypothetical protein [Lonepinella sp. BR2357]|uniref:hypothetical protein n=1 Tax=Lonepinella sp. BR2357 TaxID=3434549 RepID=UPI003F6DAFFE